MRHALFALIILLPHTALAAQEIPKGVSDAPAPLADVLPDENDRLHEYENFITGFDEGVVPPADLPATAAVPDKVVAAKPTKKPIPGLKVYSFPREVKRGMSVEKGVKVYRGATPLERKVR